MRSRWSVKSADNAGCRGKAGSQEKDCLQPSEAPGDSQAGSLRARLLHMATGEALSLPSSPSERTELQGTGRSSEGLWSTLNGIPLPLVSYPDHSLSDNTWLGSPSNLSWISSAKDSEMKLGWAHSIPNGTLVWVPLCLPVGEVGGKPVTGPCIHHLNLSWVRTGAPHEALVMQRWTGQSQPWRNDRISREGGLGSIFLMTPFSESLPCHSKDTEQTKWMAPDVQKHPSKFLPEKSL